jgi:nucleotide-binding universal stress UspA family protein
VKLQRIVVGMDFSASARAAALWTARHFARGAEIVLVHAVDVARPPRFLRGRLPSIEALEASALDQARRKLNDPTFNVGVEHLSVDARTGPAVEILLEVAAEREADVIVVGRHGGRPGVWDRLGTTAELLVDSSPVPVAVVGGRAESVPRRLLIPVEDSAIAHAVIDWAHMLAEQFNASADVLNVIPSAVLGHVLAEAPIRTSGALVAAQDAIQEEFQDAADKWLRDLLAAGFTRRSIRSEIAFGEAGQEILAAADRASSDMIVMGKGSGARRMRRLVLGSVTREVIRGAQCPVLIVTRPTRTKPAPRAKRASEPVSLTTDRSAEVLL